ncbi:hypothetical protein Poly21_42910 [Allorhodopirellula heiligendammensis]|uniref:Uncharacterized protein n=1 Tax=Allorhodopirellula heiligendammensis TaxID=2714739 RepID=A0A5C6C0B2_9BACT|nr:hypothetical protein Poly21_42910 [Allorhodopirellula heiligendammensis]
MAEKMGEGLGRRLGIAATSTALGFRIGYAVSGGG